MFNVVIMMIITINIVRIATVIFVVTQVIFYALIMKNTNNTANAIILTVYILPVWPKIHPV